MDQGHDHVLEHDPVRDPPPVHPDPMGPIELGTLGQESGELLPDWVISDDGRTGPQLPDALSRYPVHMFYSYTGVWKSVDTASRERAAGGAQVAVTGIRSL